VKLIRKISLFFSMRLYLRTTETRGTQMTDLPDNPWMRRDEVSKLHPVGDRTRATAEELGMFPRRIPLAPKISAWRRTEVNEWLADPVEWAQRRRA
jgi:predicted DNA-binding transcriptional regulator AlpA